jgi:hypothetical protein
MRATFTKFSHWLAWLAACAGALAACSSASSGNGATAADGGMTGAAASGCPAKDTVTLSAACVPCLTAHCSAEQSAYAGPNWATGSYSSAGGACGAWLSCIPTCGCNDTACDTRCSAMMTTPGCMSANQAVGACSMQNCAGECAVSATSVSNGLCLALNGGTCPTANLIGCCKTAAQETCFYPPLTAAEGMQTCINDGDAGTWSTTP